MHPSRHPPCFLLTVHWASKSPAPLTTSSSLKEAGRKISDKPHPRPLPFLEEQVENNLNSKGVSSEMTLHDAGDPI